MQSDRHLRAHLLGVGRLSGVTFALESMNVYTTADTAVRKGPCKDLKNDKKVRVEGWLMSDLRVRADKVTFDK